MNKRFGIRCACLWVWRSIQQIFFFPSFHTSICRISCFFFSSIFLLSRSFYYTFVVWIVYQLLLPFFSFSFSIHISHSQICYVSRSHIIRIVFNVFHSFPVFCKFSIEHSALWVLNLFYAFEQQTYAQF